MKQLILAIMTASISVAGFGQAAQVDALVRREMKERRIPGMQVAVAQHGKIVLLRSYGFANLEDSIPVTPQSVFSINSCTKAFTGVAIMQLVEEGKVELNAPVSRYLDSLPAQWQPVTVRQLLTHISGLPDLLRVVKPTGGMGSAGSEQKTWEEVMALPMDFPTGTQFAYNQTNYALLAKIINKYRGQPFAQVFRERQFTPAGMLHTGFGDAFDVIPHSAPTYRYARYLYGTSLGEEKLLRNHEEFPFFRRTASGMKSTAQDLARWTIALQQGKLLKTKAALDTLWTAGRYNNGHPTQWALGWEPKSRKKHPAVTATGGGRAAFFVYPEDELAVVVLTNLGGASPEDFMDELAGCFNPEIPASDPVTQLNMQLRERGFGQTMQVYEEIKKKDPDFQPDENDLNNWGYRVLSKGRVKDALEIFRLNVRLYPDSWNVYDSYGEALRNDGEMEEAVKMYRRSVELNPDNAYGKKALEEMLKGGRQD
jgi:CubicO group peptidase (beta-lactamase class C family)